ncbi:copper amine oxidase [Phakopsora pachyrhizi]|uniref:Amine oxidase n=1 Tax=Phakopsora pachyrhizi TaxID=170000 RepID=A0AAV0AX80_PHAPC|nr:copper amine oxidase [Phakopsora pachyrhizi]CAH7673550.1 copper amine oxidase [Phakopsora pachyrhizi]
MTSLKCNKTHNQTAEDKANKPPSLDKVFIIESDDLSKNLINLKLDQSSCDSKIRKNACDSSESCDVQKQKTSHPLDPLSLEEIKSACDLTKGKIPEFIYINLIEHKKNEVLEFLGLIKTNKNDQDNQNKVRDLISDRDCEVCVIDPKTSSNYIIEINLRRENNEEINTVQKIGSLGIIKARIIKGPIKLPVGTQPCISLQEVDEAERIAKNDPRVIKLCQEVGIRKDQIFCDGWATGFDPRFNSHRRLLQCLMYARLDPDGNLYAHPLDFVVLVDILSKKIVHVDFPPIRSLSKRHPSSIELSSKTTKPPNLLTKQSPKTNGKPNGDEGLSDEDVDFALKSSGRQRIFPPLNKFDYLPNLLLESSNKLINGLNKQWKLRDDLKPLKIVQTDGPSFKLEGNTIEWQKWRLHIGYNYREGLIINTVSYKDDCLDQSAGEDDKLINERRNLFYRLSVVEMVVPYGSPESPHHRKFAFDVGEYGLGNLMNSLSLGCDCLGSIQYLDVLNVSLDGQPILIKNAICIHEEDDGILWKHSDLRPNGKSHTVRSRKLVISMICTVANYEYLFYWNFFQDGSIAFDVKLSGILNIALLTEEEQNLKHRYGVEVAPRLLAQHHSHVFCLRIDPMIDGINNSVVRADVVPLPEPTGSDENYLGNGFSIDQKVLKTTDEGAEDFYHEKDRSWSIINPNKLHYSSKQPIGYRINCRNFLKMLSKADSMISKRAPFIKNDLFVTPFVDNQFYPSGKYVPGNDGSFKDTLQDWLEGNKVIENTDIVTYLTFGLNHVATPEQFPIMSSETISVSFKPAGFFSQNPSLGKKNPFSTIFFFFFSSRVYAYMLINIFLFHCLLCPFFLVIFCNIFII